jgi:Cu+-exporting ATPase
MGLESVRDDRVAEAAPLRRPIKGNLFWAFAYNAAAIPLAAAGYLNPLIAAAAVSARSAWTRHRRRRATTTSRC